MLAKRVLDVHIDFFVSEIALAQSLALILQQLDLLFVVQDCSLNLLQVFVALATATSSDSTLTCHERGRPWSLRHCHTLGR